MRRTHDVAIMTMLTVGTADHGSAQTAAAARLAVVVGIEVTFP
jgi:hypothetical protein